MSGLALPNMYVSIDLGAMSKPDLWSYNTPGSPNWDKFIYNGSSDSPMYFNKEKTIKVMKEFKRFGLGEHLSAARTISIGYDVSAVRDYMIKQKKDKLEKAKKKLVEVEKRLGKIKAEEESTATKDLFSELEREENIAYRERIEKEKKDLKDALEELFTSLENMEKENYNRQRKKRTAVRVAKPRKVKVSTSKSQSRGQNSINLNNSKWIQITYGKEIADNSITIVNNKIMRKFYSNHKPDGYSKYTILSHPQKNYWIIKGGNYDNFHRTHPPVKYILVSNGKYLEVRAYNNGNYYIDDYVTDNDFVTSGGYYKRVK